MYNSAWIDLPPSVISCWSQAQLKEEGNTRPVKRDSSNCGDEGRKYDYEIEEDKANVKLEK